MITQAGSPLPRQRGSVALTVGLISAACGPGDEWDRFGGVTQARRCAATQAFQERVDKCLVSRREFGCS